VRVCPICRRHSRAACPFCTRAGLFVAAMATGPFDCSSTTAPAYGGPPTPPPTIAASPDPTPTRLAAPAYGLAPPPTAMKDSGVKSSPSVDIGPIEKPKEK